MENSMLGDKIRIVGVSPYVEPARNQIFSSRYRLIVVALYNPLLLCPRIAETCFSNLPEIGGQMTWRIY